MLFSDAGHGPLVPPPTHRRWSCTGLGGTGDRDGPHVVGLVLKVVVAVVPVRRIGDREAIVVAVTREGCACRYVEVLDCQCPRGCRKPGRWDWRKTQPYVPLKMALAVSAAESRACPLQRSCSGAVNGTGVDGQATGESIGAGNVDVAILHNARDVGADDAADHRGTAGRAIIGDCVGNSLMAAAGAEVTVDEPVRRIAPCWRWSRAGGAGRGVADRGDRGSDGSSYDDR